MSKILKVKDIAKQYGVSSKSVMKELADQGIETPDAENSVIPDDMVELVEMFFADLYEQDEPVADKKRMTAAGTGKTAADNSALRGRLQPARGAAR